MANPNTLLAFFVLVTLSAWSYHTTEAAENCLDTLPEFRAKSEAFYMDDETPFDDDFKAEFLGFSYFEADSTFCIDAKFTLSEDTKAVDIPTFNGKTMPFRELGVFQFKLEGETEELTAYQRMDLPEDKRQWVLVAFRDRTNSKETYGGGRYLEIELPIPPETVIDFNRAANPFCAYQSKFTCPVPPVENWLKARIPVGELDYAGNADGDI